MLSEYFKIKTKSKKFDEDLLWSMGEIKNKKVILYGAGEGFLELNKRYDFKNTLNIVAIADKKFEEDSQNEFKGIKAIKPDEILNQEYEVILVTNECPRSILKYLFETLKIENKDIRTVFNEEIKDEAANLNYLKKFNFDKNFEKLNKKLKGKSIVIYGGGVFFELINKYYDLTKLNIIGISDKRFENHEKDENFLGYNVCSPDEIKELNPDYVLVATKFFINVIEDLYYNLLKDTKIKIKPLVKKPLITIIKEIWT